MKFTSTYDKQQFPAKVSAWLNFGLIGFAMYWEYKGDYAHAQSIYLFIIAMGFTSIKKITIKN